MQVWTLVTALFDYLPLSVLIEDAKAFALHAGLSPVLTTLDQIKDIDRIREVPHEGMLLQQNLCENEIRLYSKEQCVTCSGPIQTKMSLVGVRVNSSLCTGRTWANPW